MQKQKEEQSLLLIDTCGERGTLALFRAEALIKEALLPERAASAHVLGAVRELFEATGSKAEDLDQLGVVTGPGSFTGIRVGVALSQGLAESLALPIGTASRLAVLWDAGGLSEGLAILKAGRDEVYVREVTASFPEREFMLNAQGLADLLRGRSVVYAEDVIAPFLEQAGRLNRVEITARHAYRIVKENLESGGTDAAHLDGNYARDEVTIYRRPSPGL